MNLRHHPVKGDISMKFARTALDLHD